jgi:hypothetical protein
MQNAAYNSVSTMSTNPQVSQVNHELDDCFFHAGMLEENVVKLITRLADVTRSNNTSRPADPTDKSSELVPLAHTINRLKNLIVRANDNVLTQLELLEL